VKRLLGGTMILLVPFHAPSAERDPGQAPAIDLPEPRWPGAVSVEQALRLRRSVRSVEPIPPEVPGARLG
jgi:hypothetical protein